MMCYKENQLWVSRNICQKTTIIIKYQSIKMDINSFFL